MAFVHHRVGRLRTPLCISIDGTTVSICSYVRSICVAWALVPSPDDYCTAHHPNTVLKLARDRIVPIPTWHIITTVLLKNRGQLITGGNTNYGTKNKGIHSCSKGLPTARPDAPLGVCVKSNSQCLAEKSSHTTTNGNGLVEFILHPTKWTNTISKV